MVEWFRALGRPGSLLVTWKNNFFFFLVFFYELNLVLSLSGPCELISVVCLAKYPTEAPRLAVSFCVSAMLAFPRKPLMDSGNLSRSARNLVRPDSS